MQNSTAPSIADSARKLALTAGRTTRSVHLLFGIQAAASVLALAAAYAAGTPLNIISKLMLVSGYSVTAIVSNLCASALDGLTCSYARAWRLSAAGSVCGALGALVQTYFLVVHPGQPPPAATLIAFPIGYALYFVALFSLPFRPLDKDERPLLMLDMCGLALIASAALLTVTPSPAMWTTEAVIGAILAISMPVLGIVTTWALFYLLAREWQQPTRTLFARLLLAGAMGFAGDLATPSTLTGDNVTAAVLADTCNTIACVILTLAAVGATKSIGEYVRLPITQVDTRIKPNGPMRLVFNYWLHAVMAAAFGLLVWSNLPSNNLTDLQRIAINGGQLGVIVLLTTRQQIIRSATLWLRARYVHLMQMPQALSGASDLQSILKAGFAELGQLIDMDHAMLALTSAPGDPAAPIEVYRYSRASGLVHPGSEDALNADMRGLLQSDLPATNILRHAMSWIGVPLWFKENRIGALSITSDQSAIYTANHIELLMAFSAQITAAITAYQLRQTEAKNAAIVERSRLARELHDSVSQQLFAASLMSRTAQQMLIGVDTPASAPLAQSLLLTDGALSEMRALIFELRPESLHEEGLIGAFKKQAAALCARHGIDVQTTFDIGEPDMPITMKEALYRVGMEAIQNTIKHAGAQQIRLRLGNADGMVVLEVQDNGRGFDPHGSYPGHLGLKTMRERIEQFGGQVNLSSAKGVGTTVRAALRH